MFLLQTLSIECYLYNTGATLGLVKCTLFVELCVITISVQLKSGDC